MNFGFEIPARNLGFGQHTGFIPVSSKGNPAFQKKYPLVVSRKTLPF